MRELKFKYVYKHKKSGDIKTCIYDILEIQEYADDNAGDWQNWIYNYEIIDRLQYTGLKDNEREVFQGDIYEWCGLVFPITIDDYHGYRFMFGMDQLVRAYIQHGKYLGNIHNQEAKDA